MAKITDKTVKSKYPPKQTNVTWIDTSQKPAVTKSYIDGQWVIVGGGVTDYEDIKNKPTINGVELDGNKTSSDLGVATSQQGVKADTAYQKPQTGIPESDLSSDVQSQLNKHFKGWFNTLDELKAEHTATDGDSAYVKDASPATTWSIYVYDSTASSDNYWADSGTDADTTYVQTFASSQEVNEVHIVNDLTTGGVDDVLSAEQGKSLNDKITTIDRQINNTEVYYGQETDPATLTALEHVYNGFQIKVPTAGTSLANTSRADGSSYRNARVPVDGAKKIIYNSYNSSYGYGSMFVDENDIVISGYAKTSNVSNPIELDVPSNAKFFIFSYTTGNSAEFNHITVYYDAQGISGEIIEAGTISSNKLSSNAVSDKLIKDTIEFISFNHHNRETDEVGKYLVQSTGKTASGSTMRTSDFIPISQSGLIVTGTGGAYGRSDGGVIVYDINQNKIRGSVTEPYIYTYQEGDAYLRFSYRTIENPSLNLFGVFDLNTDGTSPLIEQAVTNDFPYKLLVINNSSIEQVIDKKYVPELLPSYSLAGGGVMTSIEDNLAANTALNITNFPSYIKNNYTISTKAIIPSGTFGESSYIRIGLHYGVNFSIKISTNSVALQRYDSTNGWLDNKTYTHGLNISDSPFVSVELSLDWAGGTFRIITLDGCFVQSWHIADETPANYERYGKPFIVSNIDLSNVKLSATSPMFRKPIWVLGDSYTSMYDARWVYQMVHTFGVDNFMLDGLAGGTSAQLYSELIKLLQFGTPRYLVWCLGMNDTYDWQYYQTVKNVEMICRENGIELVLATIPWPTGGSKKNINDYVKASGYRYVDQYAAVSSDDNGTWYSGMNGDGTHPTVNGAKAIAAQVLVDFPEIANYK